MNDALESLNLTQRSQSNANEMSWDERGCFGSAQCAHKNVKSPREREPRAGHQVFIDAPLRIEPLGKFRGRQTRLSHHQQTPCPCSSLLRVPHVHTRSNFNGHTPTRRTRLSLHCLGVCHVGRRSPESSRGSISPVRCI
jgi:hypothetical protein